MICVSFLAFSSACFGLVFGPVYAIDRVQMIYLYSLAVIKDWFAAIYPQVRIFMVL